MHTTGNLTYIGHEVLEPFIDKDRMIEINGVRKVYRGAFGRGRTVVALSDVTLRLSGGEIFSMLGPNGAGKSTLAKIMLGVTIPTGGRTTVLGLDAGHPEAKRRIGFLPENLLLPPHLRVREVLQLWGGFYPIPRKELERRIDEVLAIVDMTENGSQKIRTLSKGMAQRIGLAQALLHDPDLLILDEPTDGLDPVGRRQIRELLLALSRKGKTIFMNSHLLSEVERISDRVGFLSNGRLLAVVDLSRDSRTAMRHSLKVSIPEEKAGLLRQQGVIIRTEGQVGEVSAFGTENLTKTLKTLKELGVEVLSTNSDNINLEDLYVSLIGTSAQ